MLKLKSILFKRRLKISVGGLFFIVFLFAAFSENQQNTLQLTVFANTTSPYMPEKVIFCGEEVPINYFDVFESLEREMIVNTYFHSQTLFYLKKASRYLPVIEPILKKNNIPDDFKYIAIAESGFTHIVSPAGAAGFWQILESTAKEYGLEVNDEVDERYHLEKATEVACEFFKHSYAIYKDWSLVAATYNAGRRGVERQIERQGETSYYDLLLNEETARYVYRIIAIKLVLENPMQYGFNIPDSECYRPIPFHEISVSSSIDDMGIFAQEHGTNYKLLKLLNPWLRDNKLLNNQQKTYIIRIPVSREFTK